MKKSQKNFWRSIIVFTLALIFALSCAFSAFAHEGHSHGESEGAQAEEHNGMDMDDSGAVNNSADYAGHWAETVIKKWTDSRLLDWHHGGEFSPDATARQSEFVSLLNVALGETHHSDDTAELTRRQAAELTAERLGLETEFVIHEFYKGYDDGQLHLDAKLTRAQALTLVDRIAEYRAHPEFEHEIVTYVGWYRDLVSGRPEIGAVLDASHSIACGTGGETGTAMLTSCQASGHGLWINPSADDPEGQYLLFDVGSSEVLRAFLLYLEDKHPEASEKIALEVKGYRVGTEFHATEIKGYTGFDTGYKGFDGTTFTYDDLVPKNVSAVAAEHASAAIVSFAYPISAAAKSPAFGVQSYTVSVYGKNGEAVKTTSAENDPSQPLTSITVHGLPDDTYTFTVTANYGRQFGNPENYTADYYGTRTYIGNESAKSAEVVISGSEHAQEITTDYGDLWESDEIVVKVGVPVRWYVYAAPDSLPTSGMACGKTIKIPGLGWGTATYNKDEGHLTLAEGKNFVYEFTPTEIGDIQFSCWMGPDCHGNVIHVTADGTYTPSGEHEQAEVHSEI
jgi:hypothetical protein